MPTKPYREGHVFDDGTTPPPPPEVRVRVPWGLETMKLIVSIVVSVGTSIWIARGILADVDKRLTIVEEVQKRQGEEIVPRTEHNQYWKALEQRMASMQDDIRDIRRTQQEDRKRP